MPPNTYPEFAPQDRDALRRATDEILSARRLHHCSVEMASTERRLRLLVEEVGATAAAIETLDMYRRLGQPTEAAHAKLLDELIQVAACAIRWASAEMRDGTKRW
jgi:hypothetical protein